MSSSFDKIESMIYLFFIQILAEVYDVDQDNLIEYMSRKRELLPGSSSNSLNFLKIKQITVYYDLGKISFTSESPQMWVVDRADILIVDTIWWE